MVDAQVASDTWTNVPANCQGAQISVTHICRFLQTQIIIQGNVIKEEIKDPAKIKSTPYDQWNLIAVEPGPVTHVTCTHHGGWLSRFELPVHGYHDDNPWDGEYYGNVGMCRGWINGGNGPVDMSVTYQSTK